VCHKKDNHLGKERERERERVRKIVCIGKKDKLKGSLDVEIDKVGFSC